MAAGTKRGTAAKPALKEEDMQRCEDVDAEPREEKDIEFRGEAETEL